MRDNRRLGSAGRVAQTIAHDGHRSAILVLNRSRDVDMTHRCLELDEGVGLVVIVGWASLAVGAEVGIVAYSALVPVSRDVWKGGGARRRAQRAIAADAIMSRTVQCADSSAAGRLQLLVDGHKAMVWVDEWGVGNASGAIIPVGTIEALVADALDLFIAAVANGVVGLAATWVQSARHFILQPGSLNSWDEAVLGMMAMAVLGKARSAEIKVLACGAVDKVRLGELLDTAVACADA